MKRAITGIVAAGLALGMMAPAAFAATSSNYQLSAAGGKTITVDGSALYTGVQAATAVDAGTTTSYFPIWYLEQALTKAGYTNNYDSSTNTWNIQMPGVNASNVAVDGGVGSGNAAIAINGIVVKKFNAAWHKDFAGGANAAVTTYFPIYYLGNVLSAAGFSNAWNGSSFGFQSAYGQAAAVKLSVASSSILANGSATDAVTAEVVDANGHVVRNFNGTASLSLIGSGVTLPSPATVTFTNGVGTFNLTSSGMTVGQTATVDVYGLTPTNGSSVSGNINYSSVTVNTVAPGAAQLGLAIATGSPTGMSANTQNNTNITATVEDASGATYTAGQYVTLTLTGPGSFVPYATSSTPVTTETVWATDGTVNATVYSIQGEPGTITVSATGTGVTPATLNIPTYVNTATSGLGVTSKAGTDANGNSYTLYTVQLLDTNGNPVTGGTGTVTVSDNTAVQGGTLVYGSVDSNGNFTAGSKTLTLQNGVATIAVENTAEGTSPVTLTFTDGSMTANADYNYASGTDSTVTVSPSSGKYDAEAGQSVTYTAQLVDANGNAVAEAGKTVNFEFATNNAGAVFANGTSQGVYSATTDANGVATVTVLIPSTAQTNQDFSIEASDASAGGSPVAGASTWVVSAADFATSVSLSGAPTSAVTAGSSINGITATAENAVGTAVSGDQFSVTSSNSSVVSVTNSPISSGDLNNAGLTAEQAGTATITVTDISNPNQPSASFTVNVAPGQVAGDYVEYMGQQISSSNPLTVAANTPVALTVANVDAGNNPVPVTGTTAKTVYLSDSNGGAYSLTPGGAPVASVQIPVGQSSVTVYYVNGTAQTITGGLTAGATAPASVVSSVKVGTGTQDTSDTSVSGDNPYVYTVIVNNQNGVGVTGLTYSDFAAKFGSYSYTGVATATANGDFTVTEVGNGVYTLKVYVPTSTTANAGTLTVTVGGVSGSSAL